MDADGISFFDVNLPLYFERNGLEKAKRRILWGFQRLSDRMKKLAAGMTHENEALNRLLASCVEESQ